MFGRAILNRANVQIEDALADPEYPQHLARTGAWRGMLAVPMLRGESPIGAICVMRGYPGQFSKTEIKLLETFADQAVIAIENARLFEELQARNRDLTALGEVGRAVSSTLDLRAVMRTIVDRAVELSGTDGGSIFYFRKDVGRFELGETTGLDEEVVARFRELDIAAGQTGLGEAIANRQPLQVPDVLQRPSNALRDAALEAGLRAALIVPLLGSEGPLGALVLQRRRTGVLSQAVVNLMQSFADQSAIALENARLFEEIARKSRELEIANQHAWITSVIAPVLGLAVHSRCRGLATAVQVFMACESIRGGKRHWMHALPPNERGVSGALWLFRQLPCLLEERLLWPKKA
jgi:GAF domain-containing protein